MMDIAKPFHDYANLISIYVLKQYDQTTLLLLMIKIDS